jgi:hypothetical protein
VVAEPRSVTPWDAEDKSEEGKKLTKQDKKVRTSLGPPPPTDMMVQKLVAKNPKLSSSSAKTVRLLLLDSTFDVVDAEDVVTEVMAAFMVLLASKDHCVLTLTFLARGAPKKKLRASLTKFITTKAGSGSILIKYVKDPAKWALKLAKPERDKNGVPKLHTP